MKEIVFFFPIVSICIASAAATIYNGPFRIPDPNRNLGHRSSTGEPHSLNSDILCDVVGSTLKPVSDWDELVADYGISFSSVWDSKYVFLDVPSSAISDLTAGNTIAFQRSEYPQLAKLGSEDELMNRDPVIFLEIQSVLPIAIGSGTHILYVVRFEWVKGDTILPTATVECSRITSPSRTTAMLENSTVPTTTRPSSSLTSGDILLTIIQGVTITFRANIEASLGDFILNRRILGGVWTTSLSADVSATLQANLDFDHFGGGEIVSPRAIPNLGFSRKFAFVGRLTLGFEWGVTYETRLHCKADMRFTFGTSYSFSQTVTAGLLQTPHITHPDDPPREDADSSGLAFNREFSMLAEIDGFLGIRPTLYASLDFPFFEKSYVSAGVTLGIEADIQANSDAFSSTEPVGIQIGDCSKCHYVRGNIFVKGTDLSGDINLAGIYKEHLVILEEVFEPRQVSTVCMFHGECADPPPQQIGTCDDNSR